MRRTRGDMDWWVGMAIGIGTFLVWVGTTELVVRVIPRL